MLGETTVTHQRPLRQIPKGTVMRRGSGTKEQRTRWVLCHEPPSGHTSPGGSCGAVMTTGTAETVVENPGKLRPLQKQSSCCTYSVWHSSCLQSFSAFDSQASSKSSLDQVSNRCICNNPTKLHYPETFVFPIYWYTCNSEFSFKY